LQTVVKNLACRKLGRFTFLIHTKLRRPSRSPVGAFPVQLMWRGIYQDLSFGNQTYGTRNQRGSVLRHRPSLVRWGSLGRFRLDLYLSTVREGLAGLAQGAYFLRFRQTPMAIVQAGRRARQHP
jgi:hypothetical protein